MAGERAALMPYIQRQRGDKVPADLGRIRGQDVENRRSCPGPVSRLCWPPGGQCPGRVWSYVDSSHNFSGGGEYPVFDVNPS